LKVRIFWLVFVITLILDQVVKYWVRKTLMIGQSWPGGPLPGIFEITLTYNKGIAFGMFQGSQIFMTPIALVIAGFAAYAVIKKGEKETRWSSFGLGLLASGAIGNLIDRLISRDGVTDMFLIRLANITKGKINDFPVFNIADACISVAMVMLLIHWTRPEQKQSSKIVEETLQKSEE
jgi:signal peptidase II